MHTLKLLAIALSLAIACLGLLGMTAPGVLLEFARLLLVPPALYGVAAVRLGFGALLIAIAGASRMPTTLRVFGILIVIAGLLTPFVAVEWFRETLGWLSGSGLSLLRVIAVLPLVIGLFLAYAIHLRPRSAA
jgi:hypothetical protein